MSWGAPRIEDGWVRITRAGPDTVDVQIIIGDVWQPAYHDADDVMVRPPPGLQGFHIVSVAVAGRTTRIGRIRL